VASVSEPDDIGRGELAGAMVELAQLDTNGRRGELIVRTADPSLARRTRWAWHHRVVIGGLSLLVGEEGVGKGVLAALLLAAWTRGALEGEFLGRPVNVAVLAAEDGLEEVWIPRLEGAGAISDRVMTIEREDGGNLALREDRDRIDELVREHGIEILFVDALLDVLGAGVDDWRQKQVREALSPVRTLAKRNGLGVLATLHPNKKRGPIRDRIPGSGFNAFARVTLYLGPHPTDEERKVLVRAKGNLSIEPPSIEFAIESKTIAPAGEELVVPVAVDVREGLLSYDDLEAADRIARAAERGATLADAAELIRRELPEDGEWHPAAPIYAKAELEGISEATLRRARERLPVDQRREATAKPRSLWRWRSPLTALYSSTGRSDRTDRTEKPSLDQNPPQINSPITLISPSRAPVDVSGDRREAPADRTAREILEDEFEEGS
jgi:hypothetical protein